MILFCIISQLSNWTGQPSQAILLNLFSEKACATKVVMQALNTGFGSGTNFGVAKY